MSADWFKTTAEGLAVWPTTRLMARRSEVMGRMASQPRYSSNLEAMQAEVAAIETELARRRS